MLGVPTYWRTLERDAVNDKTLLELISKADIVSPWTVGRYSSPEQAVELRQEDDGAGPRLVQAERARTICRLFFRASVGTIRTRGFL